VKKKNTSTEIEVIRNACTANVDGETFGEATGASTQAGAPRLASRLLKNSPRDLPSVPVALFSLLEKTFGSAV
jgi:hypothetical protein